MSELRDRIAAAIYRHTAQSVPNSSLPWLTWEETFPEVRKIWLGMADAVIEALGLREEVEQRGAYIRRADGTSVPLLTVRRYTTPYTPEGNQ